MENLFLRLVAWCYQYPLTVTLALGLAAGISFATLVEEEPVYQGEYWLKCGPEMPILAKAYHFENQFYYEVDGKRLLVKLSKCTITKHE